MDREEARRKTKDYEGQQWWSSGEWQVRSGGHPSFRQWLQRVSVSSATPRIPSRSRNSRMIPERATSGRELREF
jgi:hypothetical protein